ncbi:shieldin complex subunit 2 isoform X2 [Manis javanica]|nr:shieldin complex subunit 2 isoform X1 [Manis javanica]XP_017535171.1 shieldin complex subunit 2 isoform X1 [Manis javanica]XP_017535172.1 shieldin complex subunit 2 isoform X1 [Manis javanica]XP_017535175.1 shieldin complex subunit 2 isoform X1 [Manis javanica]XP_017535176.1 shieldin complex subunit 2 isoform X1 [Manis javanica]XP_036858415.1 shieldin complex subunit 2 isoform X1 [Manis javanica]XP_036858416.1 shieldin complex subunit 2 isoform X1 [Manis javanica]XP_036858418.1 shieldin c
MSGGSQVHIFLGAPCGPLKMTVSQEPTSLMTPADPWKKIQLLYKQHSLYLEDDKCNHKNLEDYQVLEAVGPSDLQNGHFLANSVNRDDFIHRMSTKSQKSLPFGMSEMTNTDVQVGGLKGRVQHLTEEEKYQKLFSENKKMIDEQRKDLSNICDQNFGKVPSQLVRKCAATLDFGCSTEQVNIGPGAVETKCLSTEHRETENQCLKCLSSSTVVMPRCGSLTKVSDLEISTDTEFLNIMTSSQVAFLAQRNYKEQNSMNVGTINMETEPKAHHREIRIPDNDVIHPNDDFAERNESRQNQPHSLELFSPICLETKSSQIHINSDKGVEEKTGSQELFDFEDKLPPNEICIESFSSGILCSQLSTFHKGSIKRSWTSEGKSGHSKALSKVLQLSKKVKLASNARNPTVAMDQRNLSEFKGVKKTSLIKNCNSKSQKYNCLVIVLSPCHVKEINIKSGPNSGSKVPLATIVVTDQSEVKKKVSLWRTTAFWALTVFLGDIILLTDVTVHEDHWVGETVLQSTYTSHLLNLGSYSSVKPEEYSSIVGNAVLQDLLAYVSSKHSYLRDLPQRQPQEMKSIDFVELEQLQPDMLVHAVLRVVDITILTEALYSYRGQKQRKIMLTVEQAQGQYYVLVLWGPGAAWYPQLQRKKDYIWEFKYLFVQRNCIQENLELHTTAWSSCECLFDDDIRAIAFKAKFQKSTPSFVKMSDLATHLEDRYSGVILIKAQILELLFPITAAQTIVLSAHSSLKNIFSSLPNITYTGCAKCGLELETDENNIYKQCFSCLPFTMKKIYYRPAVMTIVDGTYKVCIHVGSKLIEKILLNISPDCLNRVIIAPSSEVTYGMVAADLFHSLLAGSGAPCVVKVQSSFVLDENSYPLQQDFSLLDFYPDKVKQASYTR